MVTTATTKRDRTQYRSWRDSQTDRRSRTTHDRLWLGPVAAPNTWRVAAPRASLWSERWLARHLAAAQQQYRLVVTATDLTSGELLYLPWDYPSLGLDPDQQLVADAVAASMAIPLFFEPRYLEDGDGIGQIVATDGGQGYEAKADARSTLENVISGQLPRSHQ